MHPSNTPLAIGSDATIIRLCRERDTRGLRMLLTCHGATVRRALESSLRSMLASNEIDEAMNTAAFNAWRSLSTYDANKGSLRAWFFAIARNAAREIMRGRQRRGFEPRSDDLERIAATNSPASTPDTASDAAAASPFVQALHECIDALPRMQRSIIRADLASGDVADAGELAKALGTSKNSVYVSRSNARRTLRRALRERGYEADGESGESQ